MLIFDFCCITGYNIVALLLNYNAAVGILFQ